MIIYENRGLSFVPESKQALINIPNFILIGLIAFYFVCYFLDWTVMLAFTVMWFLFLLTVFYSSWRVAKVTFLETTDDGLRLHFKKFFTVTQLIIPYTEVLIDWEVTYSYNQGWNTRWMSFNWAGKKRIDAEIGGGLYSLGSIIEKVHADGRIQLRERELGALRKYLEYKEKHKK
jgi:hypothetical protein